MRRTQNVLINSFVVDKLYSNLKDDISTQSLEMMYIADRNIVYMSIRDRSMSPGYPNACGQGGYLSARVTACGVAPDLLGQNYRVIRHPKLSRALHPLWYSLVYWDLALEGFSADNRRELEVLAYQVRKIP